MTQYLPIKKKPFLYFSLVLHTAVFALSCSGRDFEAKETAKNNLDIQGDTEENNLLSSIAGIGNSCQDNKDCTLDFPGMCTHEEEQGCLKPPVCSGIDNTCQFPGMLGTFHEGQSCINNDMCQAHLSCASTGFCQETGSTGTANTGEACTQNSDCAFSLICHEKKCYGTQITPTIWNGVECENPKPEAEFISYFDIQRNSNEFYRLPFPNDAAKSNGQITLVNHPNPGETIPGMGNPVDAYFEYIRDELDGFGMNVNIFFRFSKTPVWSSVVLMDSVYILNIDSASDSYGEKAWSGFSGNSSKGKYICHNWLSIRPSFGNPLDAGTTYAAIITTDLLDANANKLKPDSSFQKMLQPNPPDDKQIIEAWNAYSPLRNYINDNSIDASKIANASVFTTQTSVFSIPKIREKIHAEKSPQLRNHSQEEHNDYILHQGNLSSFNFQKGTKPYKEAGGNFTYDESGLPITQTEETIPFALTVPKGEAPASGWPFFLYAHGTGGDELSFVKNNIAKEMASMGIGVISLLQVQHGNRRGIKEEEALLPENSPENLFYNFSNPKAVVGNNLQAAADYFALTKLMENWDTTNIDIPINTTKLYFMGHSQGTQGQLIFAVHEPLINGIILSGAGGYIMETLLSKKEPIDISLAVKFLLNEIQIDLAHPILNLIQGALEQIDPINHAKALYRNQWPNAQYPHRDVFMAFGINDSYTPDRSQGALAKAFGLDIDQKPGHEVAGYMRQIDAYPYSNSWTFSKTPITAVAVQYMPDDYDGHFVLFNHPQAQTQWKHFVSTMVSDDTNAELIAGN